MTPDQVPSPESPEWEPSDTEPASESLELVAEARDEFELGDLEPSLEVFESPAAAIEAVVVPPPVPAIAHLPVPQTQQDFASQIRAAIKTQTINLLRATIQILGRVVEILETQPEPRQTAIPETTPEIATPAATTLEAPLSDTSLSETISETISSATVSSSATTGGTSATSHRAKPERTKSQRSGGALGGRMRPYWQRLQQGWAKLLTGSRSVLPQPWNAKLSDQALTGAIAGILVVILWATTGLFNRELRSTTVVVVPPPDAIAPTTEPSPNAAIPSPEPILPSPVNRPEPDPLPSPLPVAVEPAPSPAATVPLAPPSPPLKLTPEQKLIARIQDQVAEISNQYGNGLIQSVQANFRSSYLIVKVSDGWYGLPPLQQDRLANEMLRRAQELDFSKLDLTDAEGTALARSPVVGTEMLILKRITASETAI